MNPYVGEYKRYHELLAGALSQLSDDEFFHATGPNNSAAVIVKHLSGNLRSRFTDFLTSDGEKPWRDRESEFGVAGLSRGELMTAWDEAWEVLRKNVWALGRDDMLKSVTVRGVPLTAEEALARSLAHFSYHVGEVVHIARGFRGAEWRYLSIAPLGSDAYNRNPTSEKIG